MTMFIKVMIAPSSLKADSQVMHLMTERKDDNLMQFKIKL